MTSQSYSMTWSKMTTLSILVSSIWHQHCQTFFKISSKSNKVMVGYINIFCFNLLTVTCSLRSCCLIFLKSGNLLNTPQKVMKWAKYIPSNQPIIQTQASVRHSLVEIHPMYQCPPPKGIGATATQNPLMTRSIKYMKSSLVQVPGWLVHGLWNNLGKLL